MHYQNSFFLLLIISFVFSCTQKRPQEKDSQEAEGLDQSFPEPDLSMDNLLAWCIVPFDSEERSPEERILMLQDLGFTQYAYDWREKHLARMSEEIRLAGENNIDMMAVWMWIDANSDTIGNISAANEKILSTIKESGLSTQIWLGINANFFEGLNEEESIDKGMDMVKYLVQRAEETGCSLALYNHGDWFGDPVNQVKILNKLPGLHVGIVYNFHHAHEQIDRLPEIIEAMKPYLWVVNLNGMKKDGPKILTIGKGNHEKEMINQFLNAGFIGPWGILGHVEDRDVKKVLEENLNGLREMYGK